MDATKWMCLILLLFFLKATRSNEWRTDEDEDQFKVYDVKIANETDPAHLNYSNKDNVVLWNPKINTFTTEMQSQITNVRMLELVDGIVPTVHVAPHFKEYQVWNCSTINVIMNPNITYSIEDLTVVFNKLEMLPKHLNVLKKLKQLYLNNNQIEFVDMADFNGLNNLERMDLSDNKIFEISASPVFLPNLIYFDAYDNRLSFVNFEHWNATSLAALDLRRNQLSIALAFPNKFPSLDDAALGGNPLNCQWLNATLQELKTRYVKIFAESSTTCSKEEIDEFRKIMLQKQQENTIYKLERSVQKLQDKNGMLENTIQEFRSEMDSLQQLLKTAFAEIEQLKHKNDDLTEALYLHELETEHDPLQRDETADPTLIKRDNKREV